MNRSLLACLLGLGLLAGTGRGAEPAPGAVVETPVAGDQDLIQLNFPENMEVKALVDYVGNRLKLNILYDEGSLRKRVTIFAPSKISTESLLGLLQSVLKMTGLALVDADQPGWKKIVPSQNLVSATGRIQDDPSRLASAEAATAVTQIFPLKHVSTAFIEQTIKPFLSSPSGNSFGIEDQRLVIVTDYAENLRRVSQLVELFDKPGRQAAIRFVDVKNWDAGELARQVSALLQEKRRAAWGDKATTAGLTISSEPRTNRLVIISTEGADADAIQLIELLDVPSNAMTRTYRFEHASPQRIDKLVRDAAGVQARYQSTVDEAAGLLVVTAPPHVHEKVEALKRDLDVAAPEQQGHVRFYKLMNTSAADVLATIRALEGQEGGLAALALESKAQPPAGGWSEFLGPGPNVPPGAPGAELPTPPAYKGPPPAAPAETPQVSVPSSPIAPPSGGGPAVAGPATGGSAPAPAAGVAAGSRLVARTREALVTVDTNTNTLIVVAPPAVQQIYKQLIEFLDKRRPQVMIEVTMVTLDTSDNFSLGVEISGGAVRANLSWLTFSSFGLSTVAAATGVHTLNLGAGFNGVLVDPDAASVILRALATSARARVVSAPRILVNDNASGTLSSGVGIPVYERERLADGRDDEFRGVRIRRNDRGLDASHQPGRLPAAGLHVDVEQFHGEPGERQRPSAAPDQQHQRGGRGAGRVHGHRGRTEPPGPERDGLKGPLFWGHPGPEIPFHQYGQDGVREFPLCLHPADHPEGRPVPGLEVPFRLGLEESRTVGRVAGERTAADPVIGGVREGERNHGAREQEVCRGLEGPAGRQVRGAARGRRDLRPGPG